MRKSIILLFGISLLFTSFKSYSQNYSGQNTITTAVPFVNIGPDARAGGMGEVGAATEPDAASMHWNPAKLAFIKDDYGIAISYSPWLRGLVNDIDLSYLSGFVRLDDKSTISASLKFFSLGGITFTDKEGLRIGEYKPNEFSVDAGYSRKFSPKFSGAVSARFIYSNLTQGQFVEGVSTKPGTSVAADIGLFYTNELHINWLESSDIGFGFVITNIGSKISYSNDDLAKDFIPTNLRLGPSWLLGIDEYNTIKLSFDLNKLLVPTPSFGEVDSLNPQDDAANTIGVIEGMITSFYDAPGGFSEEMKEIIWTVGAEYWYDRQFGVRAGYFHESNMKGGRKYFTFGVGFRYNVFGLDFSYIAPNGRHGPLDNTLRFTLTFDFNRFSNQAAD